MAPHKCARTLILACSVVLLAGAVAAFRLRDDESDAKSTNIHAAAKCDACEAARPKHHSDARVPLSAKPTLSREGTLPWRAPGNDGSHLPARNVLVNERHKLKIKSITKGSTFEDDSDDDIDDNITYGKSKISTNAKLVSQKTQKSSTIITRASKRLVDDGDSDEEDQQFLDRDKQVLRVNQLKNPIKSKYITYSSDDDNDDSDGDSLYDSDNDDNVVLISDKDKHDEETDRDVNNTDDEDGSDDDDDGDDDDGDDNDDDDDDSDNDDGNDSDDVTNDDYASTDNDDQDSENDDDIGTDDNNDFKVNDESEKSDIDLKEDDSDDDESDKEGVRSVNVEKISKLLGKSKDNRISKNTEVDSSDSDDDDEEKNDDKDDEEGPKKKSILAIVPVITPKQQAIKQFTISSTKEKTAKRDDDIHEELNNLAINVLKINESVKAPGRYDVHKTTRLQLDDDSDDDDSDDNEINDKVKSVILKTQILPKADKLPNDLKKTADQNRVQEILVHSKDIQISADTTAERIKSKPIINPNKNKENHITQNNMEEFLKQLESTTKTNKKETQRKDLKDSKKDNTVIKRPEHILPKTKDITTKLKEDPKLSVIKTGLVDKNGKKNLKSTPLKINDEVEKQKLRMELNPKSIKQTQEDENKNLKIDPMPKSALNNDQVIKKNSKADLKTKPIKITEKDKVKHVNIIKKEEKPSKTNDKAKISKKTDIHRTKDALLRKTILESNFDDFYTFLPTFAPNYSRIHNPECRRHGQILMRQLHGNKLWALQMVDASAKVPSGLLRGNGNQLGDFDECLESRARVRLDSGAMVRVKGRYCLAYVDLTATREELRLPVHLLRGRDFIRSTNSDAGYFIPRFTSLRWGICMPAACDARDAEFVVRDALRHYAASPGLRIAVRVADSDCHVRKEAAPYKALSDLTTVASLIGITLVVFVSIAATVRDLWRTASAKDSNSEDREINESEGKSTEESHEETPDDEQKEPRENAEDGQSAKSDEECFLWTFSIHNSLRKLTAQIGDDDIGCVYGIRALCGIALYVSHKVISLGMTPYVNRIELTELANSPFSVAFRNAVLYTDTYLLLSGLLASYHLAGALIRNGDMSWFKRFITRYIRLTPAMAAVIGSTILLEYLGEGPQWGIVKENAQLCSDNVWRNLLYIQNFYDFEDMCAPQTHHLALDMQLTLLAAPLVWLMLNRASFAAVAVGSLHALSAWARYSASIEHNLSIVVYHGATTGQLLRTANFSYSQPLHRATPYLAGVTLGVLLRHFGKGVQLSKLVLIPGWLLCTYFGAWSYRAPAHMVYRDYQYEATEMAVYSCLASIAWALSLSWVVFVCFTQNAGRLNSFLSCHPLVVFSRLTFCMYLCQFLVFFYNVGSTRTASEFTIFSGINIPEIAAVLLVSLIFALLFDIPIQSLKTCVASWKYNSKKSEATEDENLEEGKEPSKAEEQLIEDLDIDNITKVNEYVNDPEEELILDDEIEFEDENYEPQDDVLIDEDDIILEEEEEEEPDEEDIEPADTSAGEGYNFGADLRSWRRRYTSAYEYGNEENEDDELQDWECTQ